MGSFDRVNLTSRQVRGIYTWNLEEGDTPSVRPHPSTSRFPSAKVEIAQRVSFRQKERRSLDSSSQRLSRPQYSTFRRISYVLAAVTATTCTSKYNRDFASNTCVSTLLWKKTHTCAYTRRYARRDVLRGYHHLPVKKSSARSFSGMEKRLTVFDCT